VATPSPSEAVPGLGADGARLPGAPRRNFNLGVEYSFDIGGYKSFIRADSFYTDDFYGNLAQSQATLAGDYVKVDLRTGVTIKNLDLELFVRNLTNDDAFTWRGLSNANSAFGYRMRPRTIGLQIGYSFE
jgi:outer membrane receptor protein involved in Fe transport